MKQDPKRKDIQTDMQEGVLTVEGYLGDDQRTLQEIIDADAEVLKRYQLTAKELGKNLRRLMLEATEGLGDPIQKDEYEMWIEEFRGTIPCPFKDNRKTAKRTTFIKRLSDEKEMFFTDMNIHLITEHGFFEGEGASYRVQPEELIEFLMDLGLIQKEDE